MPDDRARYALSLEEARRALDRQAAEVASVRQRATSLVVVGGATAAFIGGLAIRDEAPLSLWTILGAVLFAVLLVVAVVAQWPLLFVFTQRSDQLVSWADEDDDVDDMTRDLAIHMTNHFETNATRLDFITRLYILGLVLLVLEIAVLLFDLRGR